MSTVIKSPEASALLDRAAERRAKALGILADLQLVERWAAVGRPVIVGAVAYEPVVAPDIDLEVFCDQPRIDDGFAILQACAHHPRVVRTCFTNDLAGPNQGLYWQLRYLHADGERWKIDMWQLAHDHPGPCSTAMVDPMQRALTPATRATILSLKEAVRTTVDATVHSIDVYRAVLEGDVRTLGGLMAWMKEKPYGGLTGWKPSPPDSTQRL